MYANIDMLKNINGKNINQRLRVPSILFGKTQENISFSGESVSDLQPGSLLVMFSVCSWKTHQWPSL